MHLKCVVFYLQICSLLFSFYVNLDKINIIQNSPLYFKAHNPVAFHTHTILYNHCVCMLSGVQLFVTPWTVAHHAPLSMGFSRQGYWSELPLPSLRDLPYPGMEPTPLVSPALAGGLFTTVPPGKPYCYLGLSIYEEQL